MSRGLATRAAAAAEKTREALAEKDKATEVRLAALEEQCGKMGSVGGEFLVLLKDKVARLEGWEMATLFSRNRSKY